MNVTKLNRHICEDTHDALSCAPHTEKVTLLRQRIWVTGLNYRAEKVTLA